MALAAGGFATTARADEATTVPTAEEATADEAAEPAAAVEEQIVVTAGKHDQRLGDVPVAVTVLGVEEFERSTASTSDELLRQLPSFNLQKPVSSRYINNSNQSLIMRGLGGSSASLTLVLVDGVPLNDPFGGFINWSLVPMATLERVEVVPGGGAGAWGNQAMGGVVHLITRRPEPATASVDARYGSRSTVDTTVFGSHVRGPVAWAAHGSYFDTDGYSEIPEELRGPIDVGNSATSKVGDARVEIDAGAGRLFTVQTSYLDDHHVAGFVLDTEDLELTTARASASFTRDGGRTWQADLFTSDRDSANTRGSENDERTEVSPRRRGFDSPSRAIGADLTGSMPLLGYDQLLTFGVDGLWSDSEVHEDSNWNGSQYTQRLHTGGEQLLAGLFVEDNAVLGARWRLSGGVRVDLWETDDGISQAFNLESGEVLVDQQLEPRSEWIVSPNLGLRYNPTPAVGLRASVFQGFRAPTPNELYSSSPSARSFLAANNQLDPERIKLGAEAGVDFELDRGQRLRLTGFWNEVDDAIALLTVAIAGDEPEVIEPCGLLRAGGVCSQRRNLDQVRTRGVEIEAESRPAPDWRLWGSYTYTDAEVVEGPASAGLVGNALRRIPEHQATAQVSWEPPQLVRATLQVRYQGARFEDDRNTLEVEDGVLVDLKLVREIASGFDVTVAVENLLDAEVEIGKNEDYAELAPPRMIYAGVRFRWRGSRP